MLNYLVISPTIRGMIRVIVKGGANASLGEKAKLSPYGDFAFVLLLGGTSGNRKVGLSRYNRRVDDDDSDRRLVREIAHRTITAN